MLSELSPVIVTHSKWIVGLSFRNQFVIVVDDGDVHMQHAPVEWPVHVQENVTKLLHEFHATLWRQGPDL